MSGEEASKAAAAAAAAEAEPEAVPASEKAEAVGEEGKSAPSEAAAKLEAVAGDVKARVLQQVEFYFGDANLPRDKFLLALTKQTEEGWVPVAKLMTFKRMRDITDDAAVVVEALRGSEALLAVSADGTLVRRTVPLPAGKAVHESRQVYAKGVALDSTLDSLRALFSKYGKVAAVRMRRHKDRTFKGSVFVEFESDEEAAKALAQEMCNAAGEKLLTESRATYVARKKAEYEARKKGGAPNAAAAAAAAAAAPAADDKGTEAEAEAEAADGQEGRGTKRKEAPAEAEPFKRNMVVRITGLGDDSSRESIKDAMVAAGLSVAYTDFSRGLTEAFVRLDEGGDAAAAAAKLTADAVEVDGAKPGFSALAGEEEDAYFAKVNDFKRRRSTGGGRGGRGGGRGGRRGGRRDKNTRR